MTNEELSKTVSDITGRARHVLETHDIYLDTCSCGKNFTSTEKALKHVDDNNFDPESPADFFWLLGEVKKMDDFDGFIEEIEGVIQYKCGGWSDALPITLIDPLPFATAFVSFFGKDGG